YPDRVGEICKKRAALHILFEFRKRHQHFAALHMEMIFKMGNLDFVGRDEVVALEWWKLIQVRRCAAELNEIVGDDLHLGHGNLAFQRPDAISPDDNMTDVVGNRIDNDASN